MHASPMTLAQHKGPLLLPFRRHAVELAREAAIEDLTKLREDVGVAAEAEVQAKRSRIHRALARPSPAMRRHWQASSVPRARS